MTIRMLLIVVGVICFALAFFDALPPLKVIAAGLVFVNIAKLVPARNL